MTRDDAPRGRFFHWVWVPVVVPVLAFVGKEAYSAWLAPRMPWAAPAAEPGPGPAAPQPSGQPPPATPNPAAPPAGPATTPHVLDD